MQTAMRLSKSPQTTGDQIYCYLCTLSSITLYFIFIFVISFSFCCLCEQYSVRVQYIFSFKPCSCFSLNGLKFKFCFPQLVVVSCLCQTIFDFHARDELAHLNILTPLPPWFSFTAFRVNKHGMMWLSCLIKANIYGF